MTAAMMLPTTLPLFNAFDRLTADRPDHARLLVLLGLGYMAVWGAFGLLAHALHGALLGLLERAPTLAWHGWVIGAARHRAGRGLPVQQAQASLPGEVPHALSFVIEHWRGQAQARHAFALGLHHGLFCVGCCWALMLLMFALGTGSLGWMLLLAAVMAVEKNLRWGRHLSAPLGIALLAWAGVLVVTHA